VIWVKNVHPIRRAATCLVYPWRKKKMAYLRQMQKDVDIDFPVEAIWKAIPTAIDELDWEITREDDVNHRLTIRTSDTLTSYASTLNLELKKMDETRSHLVILGETPVTTITSTLQFSQTCDAMEDFVLELAEVMNR
jgi:hypothetical protein